VASYVTLDRDAAVLRQHVMTASGAAWDTKIQISVGRATLGPVRAGLHLVDHEHVADARLALGAVRHASIGVYELASGNVQVSRQQLLTETDQAMRQRGWSRLLSVAEQRESVLIYVADDSASDGPLELCLAVLTERELVVVSARVNPDELGELVERHAGKELRKNFRQTARL
ncbi:MAG: hypothetical protein Q8J74_11840, partial [Candidatus Didemnitutus sp.]|nr:hypothetical protein [Candidatus Didemnitutus sp.]